MALTKTDKSFIVLALVENVPKIVGPLIKDSERRVTKRIIGYVDGRIDKLEKRIDRVETKIEGVSDQISQLEGEVLTAINADYSEIDDHEVRIKRLEKKGLVSAN